MLDPSFQDFIIKQVPLFGPPGKGVVARLTDSVYRLVGCIVTVNSFQPSISSATSPKSAGAHNQYILEKNQHLNSGF
jgi:hypothetical protein